MHLCVQMCVCVRNSVCMWAFRYMVCEVDVYVCLCVCVSVCMFVCVSANDSVCMSMCVYVCMRVYVYVYVRVCATQSHPTHFRTHPQTTGTQTNAYMHTCTYTHTHIHTRTHAHTLTHTHTHARAQWVPLCSGGEGDISTLWTHTRGRFCGHGKRSASSSALTPPRKLESS